MNRYEKSKIYKIVDAGYNKCYIGSTCEELSQRMTRHRAYYFKYLRDNKEQVKMNSTLLLDEYGVENCKIELVELYPCKTKAELLRKEGEYIKSNKCVNKIISGRTAQEYRQDNKEKISANAKRYQEENKEELKQYRKDNAEYFNQKSKERYEANKEYYKQRHKTYYDQNIERERERHKKNYELSREKVLANQAQKIMCGCGTLHRKGDISKHIKIKKHQRWLQQQEQPEQEP
ncbi:MAG: hypothetical protein NXI08_17085 [bacterium]|nr:hypothetical protein [bacterium]